MSGRRLLLAIVVLCITSHLAFADANLKNGILADANKDERIASVDLQVEEIVEFVPANVNRRSQSTCATNVDIGPCADDSGTELFASYSGISGGLTCKEMTGRRRSSRMCSKFNTNKCNAKRDCCLCGGGAAPTPEPEPTSQPTTTPEPAPISQPTTTPASQSEATPSQPPPHQTCDQFITIQRAAATIWDKAARWEISYGNTKFYEIYSDSNTPPLTDDWEYNYKSSVDRKIKQATVVEGYCDGRPSYDAAVCEPLEIESISSNIPANTCARHYCVTVGDSRIDGDYVEDIDGGDYDSSGDTQHQNILRDTVPRYIHCDIPSPPTDAPTDAPTGPPPVFPCRPDSPPLQMIETETDSQKWEIKSLDIKGGNGEYELQFAVPTPLNGEVLKLNGASISPIDSKIYAVAKMMDEENFYLVRFDDNKDSFRYVAKLKSYSFSATFDRAGDFLMITQEPTRALYRYKGVHQLDGFTEADKSQITGTDADYSAVTAVHNYISDEETEEKFADLVPLRADLERDGSEQDYVISLGSNNNLLVIQYKLNDAGDPVYRHWLRRVKGGDVDGGELAWTSWKGAGWNLQDKAGVDHIYFAQNTGQGVAEVVVSTINLKKKWKKVKVEIVSPSAKTSRNDGLNCFISKNSFSDE